MMSWKEINIFTRKRDAYRRTFLGPDGRLKPDAELILRDLRLYCKASGIIGYRNAYGDVDPLALANANGRREVWDRLMGYLHLDDRVVTQLKTPEGEI